MHGDVVEMGEHARGRRRGGLGLGILLDLGLGRLRLLVAEVDNRLAGSSHGHAEHGRGGSEHEALGDVELETRNAAALDGLERSLHLGFDGDVALGVDVGNPLDHGPADNGCFLGGHDDALDGPVAPLAQLDEAHLGTLNARVVQECSHDDSLAIVCVVQGANLDLLDVLAESRGIGLADAVVVLGGVIFEGDLCDGGSGELSSTRCLLGLLLRLGLGLLSALLGRRSARFLHDVDVGRMW